ncbi:hypothetical protein DFH09DRAFT_1475607 [Mycena vulgaris]|nr:hypothetical protein DFH09DRAFT_1475607 [Mycena vulgaris]
MTWLRRVLIQDVAVLFSKDPLALIFKFAPFNALSFRNFAAISTAAIHLNSAEEARLAFQNLPQHLVASMQGALATQNLAFERERQNYQVQMDVMHSKMGQMQSLLELVAGSKRTKMSHGPSLTNLDVPRFAHAEPAPLAPCVPSSVAVLVAEELGSMLLFLGFPTDAQFMDILTSENKGQPEAQLLTAGLSLFRPASSHAFFRVQPPLLLKSTTLKHTLSPTHTHDSLDYLGTLQNQSVFNFCAVPIAIATRELFFRNPRVLEGGGCEDLEGVGCKGGRRVAASLPRCVIAALLPTAAI